MLKCIMWRSFRPARHTLEAPTRRRKCPRACPRAFQKLSRAGEEPSRATDRGQSGLRWPSQATQHVTEEWVHFFGRALERNSRAAADLRSCNSVASLLHWHWDLVQINVEDWLETSFAVFDASCPKGSHTKAATETASV